MRTMSRRIALIVLSTCTLLASCSPLAPQPDHSKFFILTPLADGPAPTSTPAAATPSSSLTIGIGPIDFPDYLRRLEVVTRASPNQLDLSAEKRWGEPLDKNFARVFSENISRLLNTQQIEKYPWPVRTHIDFQIEVNVQRFETTSDGQSQLTGTMGHQGWYRSGPVCVRNISERTGRPRRNGRVSGTQQRSRYA
jgi:uncharacterized protein